MVLCVVTLLQAARVVKNYFSVEQNLLVPYLVSYLLNYFNQFMLLSICVLFVSIEDHRNKLLILFSSS